jgi:hypothetical protein
MADYRAISAACSAVMNLLQTAYRPAMFESTLSFEVYRTTNFEDPMSAGVSLFLYRVMVNSVRRTYPSRPTPEGHVRRPQLPLDLHFILTPWATDASQEQEILGWMMRIIEDHPLLPSGLLNSATPGVFDDEENIELIPGDLSNEELFRIWDVLPGDFQISVPYIARVVRIDSELLESEAEMVLTRELGYGVLKRS